MFGTQDWMHQQTTMKTKIVDNRIKCFEKCCDESLKDRSQSPKGADPSFVEESGW